jgi:hypothetical protein
MATTGATTLCPEADVRKVGEVDSWRSGRGTMDTALGGKTMDEPYSSAVRDALAADPQGFAVVAEKSHAITLSDGRNKIQIETEKYYSISMTIVWIEPQGRQYRLRSIQEILDPTTAKNEIKEGMDIADRFEEAKRELNKEREIKFLYDFVYCTVAQALRFIGRYRDVIVATDDHFRAKYDDGERQLMERLTRGKPLQGWRPTYT